MSDVLEMASVSALPVPHRPGERILIYDWGRPAPGVVVLANAYAMPPGIWRFVVNALQQRDLRVVSWNTAGITTDKYIYSEQTDCSFDLQVQDLLEVVKFCRAETVNVVGWCTGPLVTLRAMLLEPNAIAKAVLLAGSYNLLAPNSYQKSYRVLMGGISRSLRHATAHRDLMNSLFGTSLPDGQNVIGIAGGRVPADVAPLVSRPFESVKNLYMYSRLVVSLADVSPKTWIGKIRQPVLMMAGSRDLIADPDETELVAKALPNGRSKIYSDRDHYFHFREPDIAEEVAQFFKTEGETIRSPEPSVTESTIGQASVRI
ncbi:alpha/beta fold hydrolase [Bradyrhizobium prioriisuperbiae]|uniref:alpha/beta fold hydrolase n=1 Tax=Bradyrhizobium prioriisuperbiae TaxID=2854389 RepID=UPI0028E2ED34|nr:alpha/beta fold hydrolase [Bradyrhizobium prioritasuperba]